jgi:hypothetical protein
MLWSWHGHVWRLYSRAWADGAARRSDIQHTAGCDPVDSPIPVQRRGDLEPIDYDGWWDFRFPEAVAEFVHGRWSEPKRWVLDPVAGFGTTLVVAERLGRNGVGLEIDPERARFGTSHVPA